MAAMAALPPPGPATLPLVAGMTQLGMGNGAVFQPGVGFGQEGYHFFGERVPPSTRPLSSPQTPFPVG